MQISLEAFAPKTPKGWAALDAAVRALAPLRPRFVSMTMAAAPGGVDATLQGAAMMAKLGLPVLVHATASTLPRHETDTWLDTARTAGATGVVCLRGDGALCSRSWTSSIDLVKAAAARNMRPLVGAYPDPHPLSQGFDADVAWLAAKADAGATEALSQLIFAPESFLRMRDALARIAPDLALTPAVAPVADWSRALAFAHRCRATVPEAMKRAVDEHTGEEAANAANQWLAGVANRLEAEGIDRLHLYALNTAAPTRAFLAMKGHQEEHPKILQSA